jgi:hypothetical protein
MLFRVKSAVEEIFWIAVTPDALAMFRVEAAVMFVNDSVSIEEVLTFINAPFNEAWRASLPLPPTRTSPTLSELAVVASKVAPAVVVAVKSEPELMAVVRTKVSELVTGVVVVSVAVVVESLPPQAASDSAMSDTPPALAAFLAFLDSQAFTSLLVAFSQDSLRII